MRRNEFILLLDELFELPEGTLKGAEQLESLEAWNSLGMMSFIALADEHFSAALSPRQFLSCRTVDDLLNLVCR